MKHFCVGRRKFSATQDFKNVPKSERRKVLSDSFNFFRSARILGTKIA